VMRVIAGKYRSRRIASISGMEVRPTADRLRETLFNVLTAGNPAALKDTVWIDFFAGTGAVGIEAISRGAAMVYFAESAARQAELVHKNLTSLGIDAGFEILRSDVLRALQILQSRAVNADYIFLDPPYRMLEQYALTLDALSRSTLLHLESVVIAEHAKKSVLQDVYGELTRYRMLVQGDAALSFYRKK
jgi:16S rRNA (guanine966-N2)-methyltransferase